MNKLPFLLISGNGCMGFYSYDPDATIPEHDCDCELIDPGCC